MKKAKPPSGAEPSAGTPGWSKIMSTADTDTCSFTDKLGNKENMYVVGTNDWSCSSTTSTLGSERVLQRHNANDTMLQPSLAAAVQHQLRHRGTPLVQHELEYYLVKSNATVVGQGMFKLFALEPMGATFTNSAGEWCTGIVASSSSELSACVTNTYKPTAAVCDVNMHLMGVLSPVSAVTIKQIARSRRSESLALFKLEIDTTASPHHDGQSQAYPQSS
jgi:hypothetical protein